MGDLKYSDLSNYSHEKDILKTNPKWAFEYTLKDVLKGPFPLGEPAIAKDDFYTNEYTQYILEKDFYLDGKLICKYEE